MMSLFAKGDPGNEICFLIEGSVRIISDHIELARLGAGEVFGEMHLLDVMPRRRRRIGAGTGPDAGNAIASCMSSV